MNKREIRQILQHMDEPTALRLSERHPGLTEADNERLLRRIEQNLAQEQADAPAPAPRIEPPHTVRRTYRFENLRGIAAAAACFLVCGGAVGGMFWLQAHQPAMPPEADSVPTVTESQIPASEAQSLPTVRTYALGEPFPAENLTASGTLLVTVHAAEFTEDGLYAVSLTLESDRARNWDGGTTFLMDNFLLETKDGMLSPVSITLQTETSSYPYAIELADGASVSLTLCYNTADAKPSALRTGFATTLSRALLN